MAQKEKRVEVVPLEEVLRRTKNEGAPSSGGAVLREHKKTDPYGVAVAEPRKGGRR